MKQLERNKREAEKEKKRMDRELEKEKVLSACAKKICCWGPFTCAHKVIKSCE